MSHPAQQSFVERTRERFPANFKDCRVLEVGSLDINGSVRHFFSGCDYTGIDLAPGKGVDVVCPAHKFQAAPFDTIISCEALEHDWNFKETLERCVSLLKPGGLLVVTCATVGRPEHGTFGHSPEASPFTCAYYRNLTPWDFTDVLPHFSQHCFQINLRDCDLYLWAAKSRA